MNKSAHHFLFSIFLTCILYLVSCISPKGVLASATFSLSPATATYSIGTTYSVQIILDTGTDSVSGATAIVTYDTSKLQVQDDDTSAAGTQIQAGTLFNQSPLTNSVEANTGTIRYDSGSLGTTVSGRGTMATIHFKALAAGTAAVNFVFNPSSSSNSSIVAKAGSPENILLTVNNGVYTIGGSGGTTPLPRSGVVENTIIVFMGGLFLIGTSIFLRKNF